MSIRIFVLRDVPEDEADAIRALLEREAIDYYETPAGKWGISSGAFWLRDESQLAHAKQLIEQYQTERTEKAREEYALLKRERKVKTVIDRFKEEPLRVLLYLAIALFVAYLSTKPFIDIGK